MINGLHAANQHKRSKNRTVRSHHARLLCFGVNMAICCATRFGGARYPQALDSDVSSLRHLVCVRVCLMFFPVFEL